MTPDAMETFEQMAWLEPGPAARSRRLKPALLILLGLATTGIVVFVLAAIANAITSGGSSCGGG